MINKDRIVSVTKTDYLSLIGTILGLNGTSYSVLNADDAEGNFDLTGSGAAGNKLCAEPVKTLNFHTGVTSGTVYFVSAYDFEGITFHEGEATFNSSYLDNDDVLKDAATLYKAVLSSSTITLTAVTPVPAE